MDQILLNLTTRGSQTVGGYVDEDNGHSNDPTRSITDDGGFSKQFSFVDFDLKDLPPYAVEALKSGAAKLQVQFTTYTSNVSEVTVSAYASPDDINGSAVPDFIANPNESTANYVTAAFKQDAGGSIDNVSVRHSFGVAVSNENEKPTSQPFMWSSD